jgi:protein gp37
MGKATKIEWTDHTFNPWRGCQRVSPGCEHCYAETMAGRNPKILGVWGPRGSRVLAAPAQWQEALRWQEQCAKEGRVETVFCASLADVFEHWDGQMADVKGQPISLVTSLGRVGPVMESRPYTLDDARKRLWSLIRQCPNLHFQILTKRPENIRLMLPPGRWDNIWLGVSVESAEYLWRLDALQDANQSHVQVPVLFVSIEPLLEPINFGATLEGMDWAILGGESGPDARPFDLVWARSIREQCLRSHCPLFIKQVGSRPDDSAAVTELARMPLTVIQHRKGGEIDEWPPDLRIREWPWIRT